MFDLEAKIAKNHFEAKIVMSTKTRCSNKSNSNNSETIQDVNNFKKASYSENYNDCSAANRTSLGRSVAK